MRFLGSNLTFALDKQSPDTYDEVGMQRDKNSTDDRNKAWQSIQRTTQQQAKSESSVKGIPGSDTGSKENG